MHYFCCLLMLGVLVFETPAHAWTWTTSCRRQHQWRRSWPLCSFSMNESEQQQQRESSVGDYVKEVHGGKYQFGAAGLNTAGQDFAVTGYASEAPPEFVLDEETPRWAVRMGMNAAELAQRAVERLSAPAQVTVQNQERTWEPYHVKVVLIPIDDSTNDDVVDALEQAASTSPFAVTPLTGKLAPAGGAPNPYQPGTPYSDAATIQVSIQGKPLEGSDYFLVIGTEEEKWFYRLT